MRTLNIDGQSIEVHNLKVILEWFGVIGHCWNGKISVSKSLSGNELIRVVRNELCHQRQQSLIGWKEYKRLYLKLWFKYGYKQSPLEKEADALDEIKRGWEQVTEDSWRKYE